MERELVRSVDETARVDMEERGGGLKVMCCTRSLSIVRVQKRGRKCRKALSRLAGHPGAGGCQAFLTLIGGHCSILFLYVQNRGTNPRRKRQSEVSEA